MKVPLSWLEDYVEITIPIPELADRLTFAGLEVEQIEYLGLPRPKESHATGEHPELAWDRDKLVVGKILEVKPHPNADRLTLAVVDIARGEPIQVVTGAPNIKIGDSGPRVAFALEGATLFDGHKEGWELMTLKRAKIRGIESGCMVCSEKELGLSEDHEGIILLPDDAPVGKSLADYLGDLVLEIKINPNMARCASIIGIAREVAALTGKKMKMPPLNVVQRGASIKGRVEVRILEPELNPRFTAALIRDIVIQPSPFWVQRRLKLTGMRPINNIVDVTNYVMLEIGQPLHAFDYDTLVARAGKRSPTIITRLADPGEELETLDGIKHKLDSFNILVCDTKGALSIGGIMGGAESEINDHSKNILLEAAAWNYLNIRRTMTAQHLTSEAGTRFGRGVHPSQAILGLQRAIEMMRELGGGEIAKGFIDIFPLKPKRITIDLPFAEVKRQLGVEIPRKEISNYLEKLDSK
jgi:phenylalanyl-tRNA synthetase beta chain